MVYLDNASTTFPKFFAKDYLVLGNPNSSHGLGIEANKALDEARERIKRSLGVKSGKVLFCRCATEAVEWLVERFGAYSSFKTVLCSKYEHDSVFDVSRYHYTDNFDWIVEKDLVFHQYVNQLTGTVHNIETIGRRIQSTGAFFGSDFTAAIGHAPIPKNLDTFCDDIWFSGHKFGCEQGIGAIWLSDRLFKYLGGEKDSRNNYGLLHGTPNVSGAIAMSYAMEHAVSLAIGNYDFFADELFCLLRKNKIDFKVVDSDKPKSYAINAITLHGINADALSTFLSSKGIYIGVGNSACADNEDYRVLEAFGLSKQEASETVRISFCEDTSLEDIDAFIKGVKEFKEMFV